ncbi:transcriptional regulator, TetR family [Filimonas lacunae]|uniref:Transcriptional regulator, TetR family n=1 Tax=Filimonas lacunae TaxID=477680 RepID=A0A173MJ57_9BACT|nr:TetR/AcrR family transcriptional regulator [Filimonas lacunae]BAV07507.1 transcriptional regulator, TetR family [Filimonas lacunae]SIT30146.1 transcriptional regulator, TetR family [Filimonas lacunae]
MENPREESKKKILEAARELFLKDGFEATSMRKIASAVGFSPTAIYLYYKDKSDIMHDLHCEGFMKLNDRFSVLVHVDDPFERLKAMGRIYLQFAQENSDFYRLMFILKEPLEFIENHEDHEEWEEGSTAFNTLVANIEDCMAHGYFKKQEPRATALLVWSAIHGLCTLKLTGHLDHVACSHKLLLQPELALEQAFQSLITMMSYQ